MSRRSRIPSNEPTAPGPGETATITMRPEALDAAGVVLARGLRRLAGWLETYSAAAVRIAYVLTVGAAILAVGSQLANVFTRYVLGFLIQGSDELTSFAFLWVIWMGVSMAVKRGSVTVITVLTDRGPALWRRSVATFSGLALGVLLPYCCVRSTQYAMHHGDSLDSASPGLGVAYFYGSPRWRWATTSSPCTSAGRRRLVRWACRARPRRRPH
jgi:TRAP-type C4-dicarboxylate transport system permease small subunit